MGQLLGDDLPADRQAGIDGRLLADRNPGGEARGDGELEADPFDRAVDLGRIAARGKVQLEVFDRLPSIEGRDTGAARSGFRGRNPELFLPEPSWRAAADDQLAAAGKQRQAHPEDRK